MLNPPFLLTKHKQISLTVHTPGSYDSNGRLIEGTSSTRCIEANVQPTLKWNDKMMLPEGERSRPMLRVYSSSPIRTRKEGPNGWAADTFVWIDGETYEVKVVMTWQMGVLNHTRAVAVRVERT